MKRVLITGGAGYLGSVLSNTFLKNGYKVTIFDKLFFGKGHLKNIIAQPNCNLVVGDIQEKRNLHNLLKGIDTVIHLAGITDEQTCNLNPELSIEINYSATVGLANLCKEMGIKRFIFASSCSVYGNGGENACTEESPTKPLSIYAKTKADSEKALMAMKDNLFDTICLRLATLFGLSYRMRFDLVINSMLKSAIKDKKIFISGGKQWRPFLHVQDAANFFSFCLDAPTNIIARGIFNVGSNNLNYQISDLAMLIKRHLPETKLIYLTRYKGQQSYKICFDKIEKSLGYRAGLSVESGIKEIISAMETGALGNVDNAKYYNKRIFEQIFGNNLFRREKYELV
jgi:nucleoside-diphosphate-sugar epimerase